MDSSLVIKAKYGDTLRRFNVRVDENNRIVLNMVGLRAKICSVFSFATDATFILRYVDEDGDLVDLVDDEDLHDVMRQQLKFLRIDVHMVNNSDGKSDVDGSSGSATPLRANPVSDPFLADALQALPEPLREAVYSSFSKAASSNPVLANIADSISKIGQSILKPRGLSHTAVGSGSNEGVPDESVAPQAKGPQSPSVDSASVPEALQKAPSNVSLSKAASARQVQEALSTLSAKQLLRNFSNNRGPSFAAGPSSKNNLREELVTSESRGPQFPFLGSVSDVNSPAEANNVVAENMNRNVLLSASGAGRQVESGSVGIAGRQVESGNVGIASVDLKSSTNVNRVPLSSAVPVSADKGKVSDSVAGKDEKVPVGVEKGKASIDDSFAGNFRIPPFKRSHSHSDASNGMFHKGVRCDGCGVYPITGPRFKSKIKENYDLCSICFNEFGNHTDYIRMDRPASFRGPRCLYQNTKEFRLPKIPPHILRTSAKHGRPRLDSRFILDVNVIDGTMMAPSTAFTKIWRMRNNGTIAWPKGTQLVWIGGDKLSESDFVDLEVPDSGVSAEMELDIAVDFIAPQSPGRYISYWRMSSLSGHKFGQRVWVLIQVDASLMDSFYDSYQDLNLNIPLDVGTSEGPQNIDINVQPGEDHAFHQPKNSNAPPEPVNQMVDKELRQEMGIEFPTNKATFVSSAASAPTIPEASSSVSYPIIDFSGPTPAISAAPSTVSYPIIDLSGSTPAVTSNQQASTVDALSSSLGLDGNDSVEEALLKELEEMGFKQIDLNKEVLRTNEYNLEQSIDELCGVSEWDPLLQELHDMGFSDRETNKRLLLKNEGSIKRVVMDLVNGE
ncbi:unnamed protein product [Vicia faba]|uniref:Protein NBR1 homolog n=1 Tax=Vicia faba TaxID=3906 RepID=A0AAV1AIL7_VICFA|nr:unnamed protein product [Vicia faba]